MAKCKICPRCEKGLHWNAGFTIQMALHVLITQIGSQTAKYLLKKSFISNFDSKVFINNQHGWKRRPNHLASLENMYLTPAYALNELLCHAGNQRNFYWSRIGMICYKRYEVTFLWYKADIEFCWWMTERNPTTVINLNRKLIPLCGSKAFYIAIKVRHCQNWAKKIKLQTFDWQFQILKLQEWHWECREKNCWHMTFAGTFLHPSLACSQQCVWPTSCCTVYCLREFRAPRSHLRKRSWACLSKSKEWMQHAISDYLGYFVKIVLTRFGIDINDLIIFLEAEAALLKEI